MTVQRDGDVGDPVLFIIKCLGTGFKRDQDPLDMNRLVKLPRNFVQHKSTARPQNLCVYMLRQEERVRTVVVADHPAFACNAARRHDLAIAVATDGDGKTVHLIHVRVVRRQGDVDVVVFPAANFHRAAAALLHLGVDQARRFQRADIHRCAGGGDLQLFRNLCHVKAVVVQQL